MQDINIALLVTDNEQDYVNWLTALDNYKEIKYQIIDLSKNDWLIKIEKQKFSYILASPPGLSSKIKQLFDERIFIINTVLKLSTYPTPIEIFIHENKRFLYSWLKANNLPHPKTEVFYSKKDASDFIKQINYPIVAKSNIGASGRGVKILRTKIEASEYVQKIFSASGIQKKWGPNIHSGNLLRRALHYVKNPFDIKMKSNIYNTRRLDVQSGFVIFQEHISHSFEWRIVAIGNSFFAHKKLKIGDKASGSLLKNYDNPPLYIFDFAKTIMKRFGLLSQAIDVFEQNDRKLLINEMQCIFGQSDPYQMLVDRKPGRYIYKNDKWAFEEGDFARNECFDLRVKHVLSIIRNGYNQYT